MGEWGRLLARLDAGKQAELVGELPEAVLRRWVESFGEWAHAGQVAPAGDWRTWVIMGGRGFGKTRAGAEWVLEEVRGAEGALRGEGRHGSKSRDVGRGLSPAGRLASPIVAASCSLRVALVAATIDEARSVMIEGPSGLLTLARPGEVARWVPGERRLLFANGAECALYSGRSPAKLRGPEHDLAWCDELAKWGRAGEAWDMLQMGLRRGVRPRVVVTTTPSAEPALKRVLDLPDTVVTGGATRANRYLAPGFVAAVEREYGGTRLGMQEIEGRLPAEREGSLWPWALIERARGGAGTPVRVVVGVDPPASAAGTCGIVVAGVDAKGCATVLADVSVAGASPEGWARAVAEAATDWEADRVVAEVNQGGDMVRSVLAGAGVVLPIEAVRAARGKAARAEPVAALFETGRARLGGRFPELEEQLAQFTAGGYAGSGSPDRADAMVWALWALLLAPRGAPGVRGLDF